MMYRLLCLIVPLLFVVSSIRAEKPNAEAQRLFDEAKKLSEHRKFEEAIPLFEKAIELNPDNRAYRVETASKLGRYVESLLPFPLDEKMGEAALAAIRKSIDLTEKLPLEKFEDVWTHRGANCGNFWIQSTYPRETNSTYPKWDEELHTIRERLVIRFRESHAFVRKLLEKTDVSDEERKENRKNYFWFVVTCDSELHWALPLDMSAPLYEEVVDGLLRTTEGKEFTIKERDSIAGRFFDGFFADISSKAGRKILKQNSETVAVVERIVGKMKESKQPFFDVHGWLAGHLLETSGAAFDHYYQCDGPEFDKERILKEFDIFRDKINSLPPEAKPCDYDFLYHSMGHLLFSVHGLDATDPYFELFEFALDRRDVPVPAWGNILHPDEPLDAARMLKLVERGVAILDEESKPGGRYEGELAGNAKHLVTQSLARLKEKSGGVKRTAPWKEKIDLLPARTIPSANRPYPNRVLYGEPRIVDGALFVFEWESDGDAVRLVAVDLETRKVAESKPLTVPAKALDEAGEPRRTSTHYSGAVDDVNACLGIEGYGILVFPLDDSEPWAISTKNGLPDDKVHGIGCIGGKIYAGLGEKGKESRFVKIETKKDVPDANRVETLAVSSEKQGKAPFFDLPFPPTFGPFVTDPKRNLLYFYVYIGYNDGADSTGLWSIDGKTGEVKQMLKMWGDAEHLELLPEGDLLLIGNNWQSGTLNLRTGEFTLLCAALFGDDTEVAFVQRKAMKPLLGKEHRFDLVTIADGWAWGMYRQSPVLCTWARVKLDDPKQWSLLELPEGMSPTEKWYPEYNILATPDGCGVIGCDAGQITLFHW